MGKSWIPTSSLFLSEEEGDEKQGGVCVLPFLSLVEGLVRCSGLSPATSVGQQWRAAEWSSRVRERKKNGAGSVACEGSGRLEGARDLLKCSKARARQWPEAAAACAAAVVRRWRAACSVRSRPPLAGGPGARVWCARGRRRGQAAATERGSGADAGRCSGTSMRRMPEAVGRS
jgi:hypothetical protein